jgi:hypothetical protein
MKCLQVLKAHEPSIGETELSHRETSCPNGSGVAHVTDGAVITIWMSSQLQARDFGFSVGKTRGLRAVSMKLWQAAVMAAFRSPLSLVLSRATSFLLRGSPSLTGS